MLAQDNDWIIPLFSDPSVDEVLFNGCRSMEVLGRERLSLPSPFQSDRELILRTQQLAHGQGVRLDPLQPAAGGLLVWEGLSLHLRWHALLPPVARDGPLLSLRRHRLNQLLLEDFASPDQIALMRPFVQGDASLFIIGPTGSGKTSLLISLLGHFAAEERVALLEQVPEIPRLFLPWIRLCAQQSDLGGQGAFSLCQIFDELLRLRPDRIVVGEIRQQEAAVFKRSFLAGHGGIWCTLHARGPTRLGDRLAELSGESAEVWDEMLEGSLVLMMQRERPRLREAWSKKDGQWQLIFCAKER